MPERLLTIAPMMDYTDRHDRYLLRLISKRVFLYTEMITTNTLLNADSARFLRFNGEEHPVALQLGGNNPADLATCSIMAQDFGYDEVNLNVGCPSDRVKSGRFGASLMKEPELVADCISKMQAVVNIPVTIKCRLGVDDQDEYQHLKRFITITANAGCKIFIIHARKAWLQGLSPKENRDIPPLNYEAVYRIKRKFPTLSIIINGGIKTIDACTDHLQHVDGCMIGREAYSNPYILAGVDKQIYGDTHEPLARSEILEVYIEYMQREIALGSRITQMSRHILGLYQGIPGAKAWRRHISENAHKAGADCSLMKKAATFIHE